MLRVLCSDGSTYEVPYAMSSMASIILKMYDDTSSVIGYQLRGRDY